MLFQVLHLGPPGWATTAAAMAVLYYTKINPYAVIGAVLALYLAMSFAGL